MLLELDKIKAIIAIVIMLSCYNKYIDLLTFYDKIQLLIIIIHNTRKM